MDVSYIYNKLKENLETFQVLSQEPATDVVRTAGILSVFSTVVVLLLGLVSLVLFIYASYLVFNCRGIVMWGRILIFISYFFLPILGPLGFIAFNFFSPTCKVAAVPRALAKFVA